MTQGEEASPDVTKDDSRSFTVAKHNVLQTQKEGLMKNKATQAYLKPWLADRRRERWKEY